jgi:hypothetical protein
MNAPAFASHEFHPIGGGLHAVTWVDPSKFGLD